LKTKDKVKTMWMDGAGEVKVMVGIQSQAREWISDKWPRRGFTNISQKPKAIVRGMR